MSTEAEETKPKTKAAKKAPTKGLAADAAKAKERYSKVDEATAAQHQELRDNGLITAPGAAKGYETARENMYLELEDKLEPEQPEQPEPNPSPVPEN